MTYRLFLYSAILGLAALAASGQPVENYGVQISVRTQTNPPAITLTWIQNPYMVANTFNTVNRKFKNDTTWTPIAMLGYTATNFTDTNVVVGTGYEYSVVSDVPFSSSGEAYGYIYAGINLPLVDSRGKVELIVDNTFSNSLAGPIAQLQQDLVGAGWTVLPHYVARESVDPSNASTNVWAARLNELNNVKSLILSDYFADSNNVTAVFILGHPPVPYAGDIVPDGHGGNLGHMGAWPADVFYGDMYGTWTDNTVADTSAGNPWNWNVVGDGKFDNSTATSTLEVGRVDFANMPELTLSETGLLQQYLCKDHNFRMGNMTVIRRGLIDDNFGPMNGEVPALSGWNNLTSLLGAANVSTTANWFGTLDTNSYLWAYGCGAGSFNSAVGVGCTTNANYYITTNIVNNTPNYITNAPQAVFTMLFGSYFGDWDNANNFLKSPLCAAGDTLTCSWAGFEPWIYHHMALGETIGFDARWSINNAPFGTYYSSGIFQEVNMGLMGDPTLCEDVVPPPAAVAGRTNGAGGLVLSWTPSPDPMVLGYNIYKATPALAATGPYTKLNSTLITGATNYTDATLATATYMVRAIKLQTNNCGSYYNASQGVFFNSTTNRPTATTGLHIISSGPGS